MATGVRSSQSPLSSSRSGSGSSQSMSQNGGSRRGSPPDPSSLTLDVHNLLGPTVANAFKLFDERDRPGIFFVFQDLSVRTEGTLDLSADLPRLGLFFSLGTAVLNNIIVHRVKALIVSTRSLRCRLSLPTISSNHINSADMKLTYYSRYLHRSLSTEGQAALHCGVRGISHIVA